MVLTGWLKSILAIMLAKINFSHMSTNWRWLKLNHKYSERKAVLYIKLSEILFWWTKSNFEIVLSFLLHAYAIVVKKHVPKMQVTVNQIGSQIRSPCSPLEMRQTYRIRSAEEIQFAFWWHAMVSLRSDLHYGQKPGTIDQAAVLGCQGSGVGVHIHATARFLPCVHDDWNHCLLPCERRMLCLS